MSNSRKSPNGLSIAFTLLGATLCSVSIYLVQNVNFTFNNTTPGNTESAAQATIAPNETTIPMQTEAAQVTTAPEQTVAPTTQPSTNSPTEDPNLTVGETNGNNGVSKTEIKKYYYYTANNNSSDSDASTNVQPDKDNASNSKDNNSQSSDSGKQQKTINVKESGQLVMTTNTEEIGSDSGTVTINRTKKTVIKNTTSEGDDAIATDTPDITASPEAEESNGEGNEELNTPEDSDTQSQTFPIADVCNYDSSETNNYTNITYINLQPGEYIITINNSTATIDYYIVPDISLLFSDPEAEPDADDQETYATKDPEYIDQENEENN